MAVQYAPNPHIAFVWLWINGRSITVDDMTGRPRHLESFRCDWGIGEIGTFSFSLFDPDYDSIELALTQSGGVCQFQFGYTTGVKSILFDGLIQYYTPKFLYDGIRLNLIGQMTALVFNKNIETRAWSGKKVSEIVADIGAKNGWKVDIDETKPLENREDLEGTDLGNVTIRQHSSDFNFILSKLKQKAERASDGAAGYALFFDHSTKTLHFHPPDKAPRKPRVLIWRDKDTEVIEFAPQYNSNAFGLMFGAFQAPSFDATTSEPVPNVQSNTQGSGGGKLIDPKRTFLGKPENEEPFRVPIRVLKDYNDKYFARLEAKDWWYKHAWMGAYSSGAGGTIGTIEIVGDPTIVLYGDEKYDIQVHKATGGLYYSSGIYLSSHLTHIIEGGRYTTILDLWTTGEKTGDEQHQRLS